MARLPKLRQRVDCVLPGYEDSGIYIDVWINAPQNVFDDWQEMLMDARVRDDKGNQVFELDENGEPKVNEDFEPILLIDQKKLFDAALYYVRTLVLEFSLTEDLDGNPLSLEDEDFWERLPEDLTVWLNTAVAEAVTERRKQGKSGAKLQGIIGR